MKKGLIIFLTVILILVVLPYSYLALSGSGYDSIDEIASAEILPSGLRYSINPEAQTIGVGFVKSDVYAVIKEQTGSNALDYINSEISDYGITLRKMGLHFNDGRICADLKLMYKGFLPIPLHAEAEPVFSGVSVSLKPDSISIGKLIRLNPSVLNSFIGPYEIDFSEMHPLLENVCSFSGEADRFTATVPYPVSWLMEGVSSFPSDFTMIVDFVDADELDTILPSVLSYIDGDSSGIVSCLDKCRDNPELFVKLKATVLGIGQSYASSIFFHQNGCDYNFLLFPEITTDYIKACYEELIDGYQQIYDMRTGILSDAFQYVLEGFADGSIVVGSRSMTFKESGNPAVSFSSIPALDGAGEWMDPETFRVILATNCGDYSLRQVPTGNRITALILRTHTGRPVVAYRHTAYLFKIKSLTEADYQKLMNSSGVPTYDLGEYTTKRR